MTDRPTDIPIDELIARYLEGVAGEAETDALNQHLADDPEARSRFVDIALHERCLAELLPPEQAGVESQAHTSPMTPVLSVAEGNAANRRGRSRVQGSGLRVQKPTTPTLRRSRSVGYTFRDQGSGPRDQNKTSPMASPRAVGVALAALITLAVTAWFALPDFSNPQSEIRNPQSFASVATLTNTTNAVFANTAAPMRLGGSLPPGPIHLTSGSAQIMFASTAVVDLKGPCEFEMTGPNRGRLSAGTLEADVPKAAKGFTVDCPGFIVIDRGTRFTIDIQAQTRQNHVRVIEGEVEVHRSGELDQEPIRLMWGDRITLTSEGVVEKLVRGVDSPLPGERRIFSEPFANPSHKNLDVQAAGWWIHKSGGKVSDEALLSYVPHPSDPAVEARAANAPDQDTYILTMDPQSKVNYLFWTEKFTVDTSRWRPVRIGFDQRHNQPKQRVRVAVRIDDAWFASDRITRHAANADTWIDVELDLRQATWHRLRFEPGVELSLDASADLPAGDITAFGVLFENRRDYKLRIDNFYIEAVPVADLTQQSNLPDTTGKER